MKIFKPAWVSHGHPKDEKIESCAIFSVDIHPDGSRFATGGQGEDSGRIVIWNMAPILSESKEADQRVPQMLCQLDNHLACVNCVRWSHSGKYLASGGDDKLIMVWTISKSQAGSSIFGSKGKVNLECWKCSYTLHGHTGDVLDIAWSPNDTWLATASVDNTIIIWDAERFPEVVTVLKGHTGLVKGVTWDPVGKYISSQGDDRTLRIWRTADWQSEAIIEEPFKECSGSTITLRCSWSPDGQYIISAHSLNNGGPTAQVIERDGWKYDKNYVGHRKAVTSVRFIPNLVKRNCGIGNRQKLRHLNVFAVGSRDHAVSVWLGGYPRPLTVMEDLFTSAVLDLAWSTDGFTLMACSYDGSLACFLFSEQEIGKAISLDERNELYEKMYGTSVKLNQHMGTLLIENSELLPASELKKHSDKMNPKLTTESKEKTGNLFDQFNESRNRDDSRDIEVVRHGVTIKSTESNKSYPSPTKKQIEMRTSDGKRRITPIYIPPTPDSDEAPAPFGSERQQNESDKIKVDSRKSNIMIERLTNVASPNINNTSGMNGAVFVSSDREGSSQISTQKQSLKRVIDTHNSKQVMSRMCSDEPQLKLARINEEPVVSRTCTADKDPVVSVIMKGVESSINLPPMPIKPMHEFIISKGGYFVVDNKGYNVPKGPIVSVKVIKNNNVVWEHVFGYKIVGVSSSDKLVALALLDTSVYVIDIKDGTFQTPALFLGCLATNIVLNNSGFLMVITVLGDLHVWNVLTHTAVISKVSLGPILSGYSSDKKSADTVSTKIKFGTLSEQGIPMIVLNTGKAYVYSLSYQSWSIVVDNNNPIFKNMSQQVKLNSGANVGPNVSSDNKSCLPLCTLQSHCYINSRNLSIQSSEISPLCTQSVLENQLNVCKTIQSPVEYRQWLLTTVNYYLQQGSENRLRILCEDLLGPSHSFARLSSSWEPMIMGLKKHDLLNDILGEIGKSIYSQRLYTEYREQLNSLQTSKKLNLHAKMNGVSQRLENRTKSIQIPTDSVYKKPYTPSKFTPKTQPTPMEVEPTEHNNVDKSTNEQVQPPDVVSECVVEEELNSQTTPIIEIQTLNDQSKIVESKIDSEKVKITLETDSSSCDIQQVVKSIASEINSQPTNISSETLSIAMEVESNHELISSIEESLSKTDVPLSVSEVEIESTKSIKNDSKVKEDSSVLALSKEDDMSPPNKEIISSEQVIKSPILEVEIPVVEPTVPNVNGTSESRAIESDNR